MTQTTTRFNPETTALVGYNVFITSSDAVIEGLTFQNSQIQIQSASPTIRNCRFVDTIESPGSFDDAAFPFDYAP